MKKRTNCKFVIISIRVEIVRLVRIKAYKRIRFGKIERARSHIADIRHSSLSPRFLEIYAFQAVIQGDIPEYLQCLLVLLVDFGKPFSLFRVVQFLCPLV